MQTITFICSFLLGLAMSTQSFSQTAPSLQWRMWELLDDDEAYLERMLKLAPDYGINAVQFSHAIVHHAHQVLQDTSRAAMLRRLIARAHDHGLQTFIWTHEFEQVPAQFVQEGRLQFDEPLLWSWLKAKYQRLLQTLPRVDGFALTLTETDFRVNDPERIASSQPPPQRLARLANAIYEILAASGKKLIVRTFAQNPQQMLGWQQALALMDPEIIVMTKCVPFDWNPHFPDNPLLGAAGPHAQIVEFDLGQEYNGQSHIPFCAPEYYARRFRHALQKGVAGVVLRTERFANHAIDSPNEINLFAFEKMLADPDIAPDSIWREWAERRYGRKAAPSVIAALKPTAEIVQKTLYTYGMWSADQSQVPGAGDFAQFVNYYRMMAQMTQAPEHLAFAEKLQQPDASLLNLALAEKDSAVGLALHSVDILSEARHSFKESDYLALVTPLILQANYALILRNLHDVVFRVFILQKMQTPQPEMVGSLWQAIQELARSSEIYKGTLLALRMERGREADNYARVQHVLAQAATAIGKTAQLEEYRQRLIANMTPGKQRPHGVVVPMLTPFTRENTLDEKVLAEFTDWLCKRPVDILFPMGGSGEYRHLEMSERKRIMQIVATVAAGRKPVYPGVGGRALAETLELARAAVEAGADGITVVIPDFAGESDDAIVGYLRTVAQSVHLPVMIYDPRGSGPLEMTAARMQALLRDCPNVRGIKYRCMNMRRFLDMTRLNGDRIGVLSGSEAVYVPTLAAGGVGAVGGGANIYPAVLRQLQDAFAAGEIKKALALQNQVNALLAGLDPVPWPLSGKIALAALGVPFQPVFRSRDFQPSEEAIARVRAFFREMQEDGGF